MMNYYLMSVKENEVTGYEKVNNFFYPLCIVIIWCGDHRNSVFFPLRFLSPPFSAHGPFVLHYFISEWKQLKRHGAREWRQFRSKHSSVPFSKWEVIIQSENLILEALFGSLLPHLWTRTGERKEAPGLARAWFPVRPVLLLEAPFSRVSVSPSWLPEAPQPGSWFSSVQGWFPPSFRAWLDTSMGRLSWPSQRAPLDRT